MIASRFMELRKRRGLMIALIVINIGLPTIFLGIRLLLHAVSPKSYGPAGGDAIFTNLVTAVLYVFGFIVAATLGCTAGSVDLSEGVFRHLVVTGRSRIALYLARIPAGLAIVLPLVAVGFAIVCGVCFVAAPTHYSYNGLDVPQGLSRAGFVSYAAGHATDAICDLPYDANINIPYECGPNGPVIGSTTTVAPGAVPATPPASVPGADTPAMLQHLAVRIAEADYSDYHAYFLRPSGSLMINAGLWIELQATIGYIVGLGLGSLLGQRVVPVVLMIVLEIILTPILSHTNIPHFVNVQRAVVGLATDHIEPAGLGGATGPGGGGQGARRMLVPESTDVAIGVIVAWLVGWTAIGAWRMNRRDA